jgi:hypothetical protein
MPKFLRLPSTRDASFGDRFWHAFEDGSTLNGKSDGPLVKGCLGGCVLIPAVVILGGAAVLLMWIGSKVF